MGRSFDADGLVMLPRLDASSAESLCEALLTQAKQEGELAAPIADAAKAVKLAAAALGEAARARLESVRSEDGRLEAHRAVAAAWKALYDFVKVWAQRPGGGEKTLLAQRVLGAIFQDALGFMRSPYRTAWTESEHRLKWFAEDELEEAFGELGGAAFLEDVRAAHKKYGAALAIKKAQAPSRELPSVRAPLDEVLGTLRKYVLQVVAHGETGSEGAKEQSMRLLAPLADWSSVRTKAPARAPQGDSTAVPPALPPAAPPVPTP